MTETDATHGVRVESRGATEIWTIDRPDRMNALGRATVRELWRLARTAAQNDAVRAVVITGAGGRAFSAGADLKERQGMTEEDVRDFLSLYRVSFGAIDALPKPVIAALDGVAFGGGLELALSADIRVMRSDTQLGLTETSLGIIPGAGGTQRLTRLVGPARAKDLILFARRLSADDALRYGIVEHVAPAGKQALDVALELAAQLEAGAPIALGAALEAIDAATDLGLEEGLTVERRCYERTLASEDRLEALKAFQAKRKPVFRGR
ncbi:MAG: enoyl-CoA hydratase-related protein [Polyangiales bacterium]